MVPRTRARVAPLTSGLSLRTRETVPIPTPASRATSKMVGARRSATRVPPLAAPAPGAGATGWRLDLPLHGTRGEAGHDALLEQQHHEDQRHGDHHGRGRDAAVRDLMLG